MASGSTEDDEEDKLTPQDRKEHNIRSLKELEGNGHANENDNDGEEEEEEEEPKLRYTRMTSSLGGLYRNGDATSTFLVAGDKMVRVKKLQVQGTS